MKPRLALWLVPLVACALWLVLETRSTRGERALEDAQAERASPPPTEDAELAALQVPAPPPSEVGASSAAVSARSPVPSSAPAARGGPRAQGLSRGRLVDERTLEPIPDALVVMGKQNSRTDAQGAFDAGEGLDALDEVDVVNVSSDGSVQEVPRERWTRLAEGWQIPLAIGPTYRLKLVGLADPMSGPWEGRVMREARDDRRWMPLRGVLSPYLRYSVPIEAHENAGSPWVEVRSVDGLHEGRGDARSLVGVQEVEIACRERAVVRGKVVDAKGAPCADLEVQATLCHPDATQVLHTRTGKDGSYQLDASEPGELQLVVLAPLETRPPGLRLQLHPGVLQAPDVVLSSEPAPGPIRGSVRCRSGVGPVDVTVRLRALDGSGFTRELGVGLGFQEVAASGVLGKDGKVHWTSERRRIDSAEFTFDNVPQQPFELSVVTTQGFACSPAPIRVTAPAKGLEFTCDDRASVREYRLEIVDAVSRASCRGAEWLVRVDVLGGGPIDRWVREGETLELADGAGFEWWASAPGHRLGHGTARDFTLDGNAGSATCALQPGYGVRLALREWSSTRSLVPIVPQEFVPRRANVSIEVGTPPPMGGWAPRPVAGAEILADGVPVATSDGAGIAELGLDAAPKRIEVRLAGWRVVNSYSFRDGKADPFPEAEVWMVRE